MALKYAPYCIRCGKRRVKDPAGLCSYCRRLRPATSCEVCGRPTRGGSTVCTTCRATGKCCVDFDAAILNVETLLEVLRLRRTGCSLSEIGMVTNLTKSQVYLRLCRCKTRAYKNS